MPVDLLPAGLDAAAPSSRLQAAASLWWGTERPREVRRSSPRAKRSFLRDRMLASAVVSRLRFHSRARDGSYTEDCGF